MAKILVQFSQAPNRQLATDKLTKRMLAFYDDKKNLLFISENEQAYDFFSKQYMTTTANNVAKDLGVVWSGSASNVQQALDELKALVEAVPTANLTPRGAWGQGTSYSENDIVFYEGNSYICFDQIDPSNTAPSEDDAHFYLFASGGDKGDTGKSAYQDWLDAGNSGSVHDFLSSLEGEDGENGLSAYEVWLEEGGVGDEEAFLASLKGEQGEKGEQGPQGPKGEQGEKGEQVNLDEASIEARVDYLIGLDEDGNAVKIEPNKGELIVGALNQFDGKRTWVKQSSGSDGQFLQSYGGILNWKSVNELPAPTNRGQLLVADFEGDGVSWQVMSPGALNQVLTVRSAMGGKTVSWVTPSGGGDTRYTNIRIGGLSSYAGEWEDLIGGLFTRMSGGITQTISLPSTPMEIEVGDWIDFQSRGDGVIDLAITDGYSIDGLGPGYTRKNITKNGQARLTCVAVSPAEISFVLSDGSYAYGVRTYVVSDDYTMDGSTKDLVIDLSNTKKNFFDIEIDESLDRLYFRGYKFGSTIQCAIRFTGNYSVGQVRANAEMVGGSRQSIRFSEGAFELSNANGKTDLLTLSFFSDTMIYGVITPDMEPSE